MLLSIYVGTVQPATTGEKRSIFRKISFHGSRKKIREQRGRKENRLGWDMVDESPGFNRSEHTPYTQRGETEPDIDRIWMSAHACAAQGLVPFQRWI